MEVRMTLDEFLDSGDIASDDISSVFGASGVRSQFAASLLTKEEQFKLLYFKPQVYKNRSSSGIYYSIYEMLVDRSGKVIALNRKNSGY